MGYSMFTERYHYVQWRHWDNERGLAGDVAAVELYDSKRDPQENTNIAANAENQMLLQRLAEQLQELWPGVSLDGS
jgi:iduronate 2-sulfatase